jgi:hypothetical protein
MFSKDDYINLAIIQAIQAKHLNKAWCEIEARYCDPLTAIVSGIGQCSTAPDVIKKHLRSLNERVNNLNDISLSNWKRGRRQAITWRQMRASLTP